MELKDYLRVLRRNWLVIVAAILLGVLIAGAASLLVKPRYVSQTKLFVALQNSSSVAELQQGNVFTQARVRSYVETVTTPAVLQPVIDSLGLADTPASLAGKISATADANTVLISISVSDESPTRAAAIAQAVSASLVNTVDVLEKPAAGGVSPVKLSIVTPATAASSPVSPNVRLNVLIGLLAGFALGLGYVALRSVLDTRVRGEIDVHKITDAPILGGISFDADATKKPLLTQAPPQSPRAESFRQLRTNLQFAHVSNQSKTVLMTSSLPGEGKSTTATNLAIALSQAGQTVALVDADLRRPMVAEYLGLERNVGLTTVLIGDANLEDVLQPWGENKLYVLASGQVPPNPSELLGSERMHQLVGRLEESFDAVIIDAPPLLPVTDAAVLAQQVGGVVLVVGSQKVRATDVQKSLAALEMVDADLLGVVLNRLPAKGPDAYAYSYYGNDRLGSAGVPTPAAGIGSLGGNHDFERILKGEPRRESQLRSAGSRSRNGE
ncbi:polysaccharide biosynthesis tyrosine autokinase [Pseudarthrobacter defluvii]|uniref:polysaccharide biosynthesis tyrosine autokinase n=1 Tax=Pseudarthrobacter defluvii TaxID=410837 RepID=UPI0025788F49|nr:polysaccharide biosynthesis tyrosine autokinase [Pseudarthrobacter defluvii]WJH23711.1 polysaccharide biosynthesis tyrosine autokinase [Pseudarthrobacter defluvii]